MLSKSCESCASQQDMLAKFCSQCGHPFPVNDDLTQTSVTYQEDFNESAEHPQGLNDEENQAVSALLPHTALLIGRGAGIGTRFLLDKSTITVGRQGVSDIFLDDITVSRKHAEFTNTGTGFAVRDVGSLNGTYVNRDRIDAVQLKSGDEVQIGKFRLVYFSASQGDV